jgi:hypothetical protein
MAILKKGGSAREQAGLKYDPIGWNLPLRRKAMQLSGWQGKMLEIYDNLYAYPTPSGRCGQGEATSRRILYPDILDRPSFLLRA